MLKLSKDLLFFAAEMDEGLIVAEINWVFNMSFQDKNYS